MLRWYPLQNDSRRSVFTFGVLLPQGPSAVSPCILQQMAHRNSPESCRRLRPTPEIRNFVFFILTLQLIRKANDQFCLHYAVISDRTKRIV